MVRKQTIRCRRQTGKSSIRTTMHYLIRKTLETKAVKVVTARKKTV